jgi:hypothetical protein
MLQDGEKALNEVERVKMVHDIQRHVMQKMHDFPMAVGSASVGLQPWVTNYQHSATYGIGTENYPSVWIDRG